MTRSNMRELGLDVPPTLLREELARIKAAGSEVVLIDPQYAPRVIAKPHVDDMVSLIAATAKTEHVGLFHRFELMRRWYDRAPAVRDLRLRRRAAHERLELRLPRQGARARHRRGRDEADCDCDGTAGGEVGEQWRISNDLEARRAGPQAALFSERSGG